MFGIDISHHQGTQPDMARARAEGVEFAILKATEGSTFVDSRFAENLAEARAAGMLVAAYHYVRSSATAAAQVANISRVVPSDVPVIPDVEANSGDIELARAVVALLRAAGYSVPLLYLPRWYWQQIGSPSLAGLPPLWSSRYPDNVAGSIADEWADVPPHYWDGYGGLPVAVLQFTSSARVADYQPLDANAFLGTREQLAALLGADTPLTNSDRNGIWMFPCTGIGPDGTSQTHPAIVWITAMAYRVAAIEQNTALLAGRDPDDVDNRAVAVELAPMLADGLADQLPALGQDDLARIASAVADEQARRQANQ